MRQKDSFGAPGGPGRIDQDRCVVRPRRMPDGRVRLTSAPALIVQPGCVGCSPQAHQFMQPRYATCAPGRISAARRPWATALDLHSSSANESDSSPHRKATLLVSIEEGIARLTFNRPDVRNALSPEMVESMLAFFLRAQSDRSIRCILLAGAGKHFMAGGDVKSFALMAQQDSQERRQTFEVRINKGSQIFAVMQRLPQPVVCCVLSSEVLTAQHRVRNKRGCEY